MKKNEQDIKNNLGITTHYVYRITNVYSGHKYIGAKSYPDGQGKKKIIGESYFTSARAQNPWSQWMKTSFSQNSSTKDDWTIEILYQDTDFTKVLSFEIELINQQGIYSKENYLSLNFYDHVGSLFSSFGNKWTEEQKKRLSERNKGQKVSQKCIETNSKPVLAYVNEVLIAEFTSLKEAELVCNVNVGLCLLGYNKTAGIYNIDAKMWLYGVAASAKLSPNCHRVTWQYKNIEDVEKGRKTQEQIQKALKARNTACDAVIALVDNIPVAEFPKVTEARKIVGASITGSLTGKTHTSGVFHLKNKTWHPELIRMKELPEGYYRTTWKYKDETKNELYANAKKSLMRTSNKTPIVALIDNTIIAEFESYIQIVQTLGLYVDGCIYKGNKYTGLYNPTTGEWLKKLHYLKSPPAGFHRVSWLKKCDYEYSLQSQPQSAPHSSHPCSLLQKDF